MLYTDSIHTSKYTSMWEYKHATINVRYICCIQIQYILVNIQAYEIVYMQLLTLDIYVVYRFNTY